MTSAKQLFGVSPCEYGSHGDDEGDSQGDGRGFIRLDHLEHETQGPHSHIKVSAQSVEFSQFKGPSRGEARGGGQGGARGEVVSGRRRSYIVGPQRAATETWVIMLSR